VVALFAKYSPLLRTDFGLDIHMHDKYYVIPLNDVVFRICLAAATAWILLMSARGMWSRFR
jgi:hypothetical protein